MPPRRPIPSFHLPNLRRRIVLPDNLPAEIHKGFIDVRPSARARFVIGCVPPALGDTEGAGAGHGAVFFEVTLVANDDEGDTLVVFDADDLVAEFVELGEGGEGGDGEDEEEALAGLHVEFSVEEGGLSGLVIQGKSGLVPHGSYEKSLISFWSG